MESIAEKLVEQVLGEKQVYLDNARLKHGVPRHEDPIVACPQQTPEQPQQSVVNSIRNTVPEATLARSSMMKTAAMLALSATAGAFGIPPIITALAGKVVAEKIIPSEPQPEESKPQEFNDLVNWLRQEGLDRGTE
jgi:hypothetical protein